jgi:hypothetical protein
LAGTAKAGHMDNPNQQSRQKLLTYALLFLSGTLFLWQLYYYLKGKGELGILLLLGSMALLNVSRVSKRRSLVIGLLALSFVLLVAAWIVLYIITT